MEKSKEFLTDLTISIFSGLLGGLDAIEDRKEMEEELFKVLFNQKHHICLTSIFYQVAS